MPDVVITIGQININISLEVILSVTITLSLTVTIMLREWLLKPYLEALEAQSKELSNLKAEVKGLKEENLRIRNELLEVLKALNEKADKDDLKEVRLRLNSLERTLDSLIQQAEALEISLQRDQLLANDEARKELVLRLIREGYNSPKRLKAMVPFGNKKLYQLLEELEREGLVRKLKKGRKVYYIMAAEVEEG